MFHAQALAAHSKRPNLHAFETMQYDTQIETLSGSSRKQASRKRPFLCNPRQVFDKHFPGAKFINTLRPFCESGDPPGPEDVAPSEGNVHGSLLRDEYKPASAPES